jgi:hypothetical protein
MLASKPPFRPLIRSLGLLLGLTLLLSGCLESDQTLRFDHYHHGQLSQSIHLGPRGEALLQGALADWLQGLTKRTQALGGDLRPTTDGFEWVMPFTTAVDLMARFQQTWTETSVDQPVSGPVLQIPGLAAIPLSLEVSQRNWLLASRIHLIYDLDLQSLSPWLNPQTIGEGQGDSLTWRLQVPWGEVTLQPGSLPATVIKPRHLLWSLQPGQSHHIDVVFWLPNPIGLGTLGIVLLVLLGYFLRYRVAN